MKKIYSVFLAAATVLTGLTMYACSNDQPPSDSDSTNGTVEYTQPDNSNDQLGIPEDIKFDGVFSVLTYDSSVDEFANLEDNDPDMVEQSLRSRDLYVEDRLNITFEYDKRGGQWDNRNAFSDTVRTSVQGASQSWDLVATYSMVAPNLALNHVLTDMRTLDYIDFGKSWYPKFMVDASTINNKTYFISGDVSTNLLYSMQGVVFSEKQASAHGISEDELYQIVYDNEWTLENLFTMCENFGQELDGDGRWDQNDYYPIVAANDACLDSFYFATGLSLIEEDDNGVLHVSDDVLSEKTLGIYSLVYDGINTYRSFNNTMNDKTIMEEKCIFSISFVFNFRTIFAESTERFRILPFPKFESGDTTSYKTLLSMWHSQFCIPNDISDPDRSAAVLEVMSYMSHYYVVPVVFEETMKLRYSENDDCANMFDIMRSGCVFDVGSLFYMTFESHNYLCAHSMFRDAVQNRITNWVSAYNNRFATGLNAVVEELNTFYSE